MTTSPADPAPKRRRWRVWPPEASLLVEQKKHPSALCAELAALTGNDERACWRFLNKHGIQRPGSKKRHSFDPGKTTDLIDYVGEHGIQAAAVRFGCEPKALYNLLYRLEQTNLSHDSLSLRDFCTHFGVKCRKAIAWIEEGLLKAKRRESRSGRVSYVIEFEALRKFCKEHRDLLITRRFSPTRIRFLEQFVFAPKHADLVPSREAKREQEAFERHEYLENQKRSQRSA